MDWNEILSSPCFSPRPIEQLNQQAQQLDRRLFLFAHYQPQTLTQLPECYRLGFFTGIMNLYGLFQDCGPFVFNDLLPSPYQEDDHKCAFSEMTRNTDQEWNVFRLKQGVYGARSIFAHNNNPQAYPLHEKNWNNFETWDKYYYPTKGIDTLGILINLRDLSQLNQADWKKMLEKLVLQSQSFVQYIEKQITGPEKNKIQVEEWLGGISDYYNRNPNLLLNLLVSMYEYDHHKKGNVSLVTKWFKDKYGDDYTKCLDRETSRQDSNKVYTMLKNWPEVWSVRSDGKNPQECPPPFPGEYFFRFLVQDIWDTKNQALLGDTQSPPISPKSCN